MSGSNDPFAMTGALAKASSKRGDEPLPLEDKVMYCVQANRAAIYYDYARPPASAHDLPALSAGDKMTVDRLATPRGEIREKRPANVDAVEFKRACDRFDAARGMGPPANATYYEGLAKPPTQRVTPKFKLPVHNPDQYKRYEEPHPNGAFYGRLSGVPKRLQPFAKKFDGRDPADIKNQPKPK
jgi:hypothetical protein